MILGRPVLNFDQLGPVWLKYRGFRPMWLFDGLSFLSSISAAEESASFPVFLDDEFSCRRFNEEPFPGLRDGYMVVHD